MATSHHKEASEKSAGTSRPGQGGGILKSRVGLVLLLVGTLGLGIVVGFWMPDDDYFALRKNFQIFGAVYEELIGGYVDPLDPEHLMRTGIDAMLQDLDPYTTFIDEAENTDIDIITRGQYGGVGLNIGIRDGKVIVVSPIEGTSGYKQGVRTGDVITEIEGREAGTLTVNDIRNLMRGEPGTGVNIVIEREGEPEPLHFLLTRQQVKLKNVTYGGFADEQAGIGYIKLERFARDVGAETRAALQELKKSGRLNGLILDLRDNPGGLLEGAVEVAQLFVPQGSVIVSTRGRHPQTERVYRSKLPPIAPDVPLVVLVNDLSASASEIVAGSLQDLDRAVILGTTTFGKGLVQIIKPLPYNTSIKLTTSKYYTPSGRSIQSIDYGMHDGSQVAVPDSLRRTFRTAVGRAVRDGSGIEPDVLVAPGMQSELEKALMRRAAFFFFANHFAAENPHIDPDFTASDELLDQFRAWLEGREFTYRTDAERAVASLEDALAANGYDAALDEVEALSEAVYAEKRSDFDRYSTDLKEHLRAEIVARYYGESAQIEASFAHDRQVTSAIELLRDSSRYASILSPL